MQLGSQAISATIDNVSASLAGATVPVIFAFTDSNRHLDSLSDSDGDR